MRTPLSGMMGFLELLGELELCPRGRQYVTQVLRAARLLKHIADDNLDHFKMKSGRLSLCRAPARIRDAVHHCISLYTASLGEKGLSIRVNIDAAVPPVLCIDVQRVQQMLNNLIRYVGAARHVRWRCTADGAVVGC